MVRRILLATGVWALVVGLLGCNLGPPAIFDPQAMQEGERSQSASAKSVDMRSLPTEREQAHIGQNPSTRPTTGPSLDNSPVVRMSLHEIIHRAVANNYDVKVAGYQPAIEGTRVTEIKGQFDPVFFTNLEYQHKDDLTGGSIFNNFPPAIGTFTSFINQADIATYQVGLQQNLESGGQVQLQYQDTYNWASPQQTVLNPFYESSLTLQLNQPLLKNFGYDVNQAQIVINRLTQKESLLEFRKAVEQSASDIEKAYWQLVQTERDIIIQQDLVTQTESMYTVLNVRMRNSIDVSPLQVAQAQTELETRRAQLIQFKSQARDLSDQLKALMSDPEFPVASDVLIMPLDAPVIEPVHFMLQDQIDTAMDNRFELGEQQLKIDAATVTVGVAKNNLLPELDFIGSFGPDGAAADLGTAIIKSTDFRHYDATVGFKLQIPLGNRAARSIWKRTLLQRMQAMAQYSSLIEQISVDVKTSMRAVSTSWDLIAENRLARFAAEDALKAIEEKERANEPLRPEFVQLKLDTQQRFAQAEISEAQAVAGYNIAIAQLERSKGTLLRYNNVLLQEETDTDADDGVLR